MKVRRFFAALTAASGLGGLLVLKYFPPRQISPPKPARSFELFELELFAAVLVMWLLLSLLVKFLAFFMVRARLVHYLSIAFYALFILLSFFADDGSRFSWLWYQEAAGFSFLLVWPLFDILDLPVFSEKIRP